MENKNFLGLEFNKNQTIFCVLPEIEHKKQISKEISLSNFPEFDYFFSIRLI